VFWLAKTMTIKQYKQKKLMLTEFLQKINKMVQQQTDFSSQNVNYGWDCGCVCVVCGVGGQLTTKIGAGKIKSQEKSEKNQICGFFCTSVMFWLLLPVWRPF